MPGARGLQPGTVTLVRKNLAKMMFNTRCDLLSPVYTFTDTGDQKVSYVALAGDVQIPFRFENIQFRAAQLETYGGKQIATLLYKAYFLYNAAISIEKHVLYAGVEYRIRVINKDMSDNIYIVTHLSTVD